MRPKEKALELYRKMLDITDQDGWKSLNVTRAKNGALIAVEEIENALTNYGQESGELQNMDSEWRYLDEVKKELNKL